MSIKLEHSDIQRLAKQMKVNKPVLAARVVGDRIELHLLGGEVIKVQPTYENRAPYPETNMPTTGQEPSNPVPFSPLDVLNDMTVARLKQVAAYLELSGYSHYNKARLVTTIMENFSDEEIQEGVINSAFQ